MSTEATNPDEKNVAEELERAKASNVVHAAKAKKPNDLKGLAKTPLKKAKIVEGDLMPAPTSTTADVPFINITADDEFDVIRDAGARNQKKTTEHTLAFCLCVAVLQTKCEKVQGGSKFSDLAAKYWGLSPSGASRAAAIGRNPNFCRNVNVLPASMTTLFALTKLPDDDIEGFVESEDIHPGVTAKEVKALGKSKVDKNTQQAASEDAGDSEAVDAHDEKNARDQAPAAAAGEDKSEINASPKANRAVSTTLDAAYGMVDGLAGEQDMIAVVCYIAEKVTPARLIEALQELGE